MNLGGYWEFHRPCMFVPEPASSRHRGAAAEDPDLPDRNPASRGPSKQRPI
jgi:hypothetical protein